MRRMTNRVNEYLEKACQQGWLSGFDFSILMHTLLVSEHGYVMGTGNWENANAVIAIWLVEKIKKHPILWKIFFMVA